MNKTFGIICANYDLNEFGSLLDHRTISSLPIAGRYRMVDFPLSAMVYAGITAVGLIMPYYYRSLIDHVGTGKAWGLDRKTDGLFPLPGSMYSREDSGHKLHVGDLIRNHRFIERRSDDMNAVIMATSYVYNIDLKPIIKAHEESGKEMTIVYKKTPAGKKVFIDISIISKKTIVDIVNAYKDKPFVSWVDAATEYLGKKQIHEYIYKGYAEEIVDVSDYMNISLGLLKPENMKEVFDKQRRLITKTQDGAPTIYSDTAKVSNSLIAASCNIDGSVENSIIFRNATVEKGAVLKNCIVMQHAKIKAGAKLTNVIVDKYAIINRDVKLEGGSARPIVIPKNEII